MTSKYRWIPYNPNYQKRYDKETIRIEKQLRSYEYNIDHIGSTSVPGLGGKGIIDIYIVTNKDTISTVSSCLVTVGYTARPSSSNSECCHLFHVRIDEETSQIYHVHVSSWNSEDYKKCIRFRDKLRTDTRLREQYDKVRQEASKKAQSTNSYTDAKQLYMKIKQPFIESVLK